LDKKFNWHYAMDEKGDVPKKFAAEARLVALDSGQIHGLG